MSLQWRIDPSAGVSAVVTGLPPQLLQRIVQAALPPPAGDEDEEGGSASSSAAGELDLYDDATASRVEAALAAKHAMTLAWGAERWDVAMRRGSSLVHWESPLVAAQRGEGFLVASRRDASEEGEEEEEGVALPDCTVLRARAAWRCSPVEAQRVIADVLQAALQALGAGEEVTGGASGGAATSRDDPAVPSSSGAAVLHIHTPRGTLTSRDAGPEALDFFALQARPYIDASAGLVAQAARVAAGGEAWTRGEQLAKYARLRKMADDVVHRVAQAQFAKGPRPGAKSGGEAGEQTPGEGTGGGGGRCSCGGTHEAAAHGGGAAGPAPYVLTDLDQAVLTATAAAEKELGIGSSGGSSSSSSSGGGAGR